MKKLLTGMAAAALTFGAMAPTMSVFAATDGSKDVPVTYDNRNVIPDPDNPSMPAWGVVVPTSVQFSDTRTEVPVDVELVGMNGHLLDELSSTFNVNVKVKSTNGLTMNYGNSKVEYTLGYGSTDVTGTTDTSIADLTKASPKQEGKANMTGKATEIGQHTDTLTYTINNTVQ